MQDTDKIVTLASLVASGAKYHEYFNLTLYGNRYRSVIQNQNDNTHVHIEKAKARTFVFHTEPSVEDNVFLFKLSDLHVKETKVVLTAIKM